MKDACWAVVVAAGRGRRMGLSQNKAFLSLRGRSVLSRCMDALSESGCFEGAVLVISARDRDVCRALFAREGKSPLIRAVVDGGETRQDSVYNGLQALPAEAAYVAVHDAARFLAPACVVREAVASARLWGSGVAACAVTDTIKRVNDASDAVETPDRAHLRAVQTPQVFRRDWIDEAYRRARAEGYAATDDAALVEKYIGPVHLTQTEQSHLNVKLTVPEDITRMLGAPDVRVGTGFDAHAFAPGRRLVLLGAEIPCEKGLLGHSDADVAAHALMDALLGALALGDIGRHFPDNDPAYKDADSMRLLEKVAAMVREAGYRVGNADVTIVLQAPKIAPYIEQMRANTARALGMDPDRVSVKATTTEKMGYEGRGEGASAFATALVTQ